MVQSVIRRSLDAKVRVRSVAIQCGITSEKSGSGKIFFPSAEIFPSRYHSIIVLHEFIHLTLHVKS